MKFRITQRDARNQLELYRINCETSSIIKDYIRPTTAYHAGVYGWNADIFINGYIGLEEGYRPIAKKDAPEKLQEQFCKKCKKIIDRKLKYETKRKKLHEAFDDFCNELRNN